MYRVYIIPIVQIMDLALCSHLERVFLFTILEWEWPECEMLAFFYSAFIFRNGQNAIPSIQLPGAEWTEWFECILYQPFSFIVNKKKRFIFTVLVQNEFIGIVRSPSTGASFSTNFLSQPFPK